MNNNLLSVLDILSPEIKVEYESLTDKEKDLFLNALETPSIISLLYDIDFSEIPVPPIEFFTNPYYIGKGNIWDEKNQIGLYPIWLKELCHVLDPKNEIYEWVLSGCLGSGKSTVALLLALYRLYWLNCLRNPHQYFSLMETAPIEFFLFNINLVTARDVALGRFEGLLNQSPYFRERFPAGRRKKKGRFQGGNDEDFKLELPPNFHIVEGSKETHFISRDIIFGMFDEANFVQQPKGTGMTYDTSSRAFKLYIGLRNRIATRFMKQGKTFGFLCLISSAASRYDFLESHKKAIRNDPHVHISEFALYDVKPWNYCGKKFKVLLGGEQSNSKIVPDDFVPDNSSFQKVIEIPIEHKDAYEKDISTALKEFSGIPSEVSSPLIPVRDQIAKTINPKRTHPFNSTSIVVGHLSKIITVEQFLNPNLIAKWEKGSLVPKYRKLSPRYIHVDLSKSRCATGISMGCVAGMKRITVFGHDGSSHVSLSPMIFFDFMLQILPPDPPEEVSYEKIRQFIKYLRDSLHFNIATVSYDGWNSVDSCQILQNEGFETEVLSMDRTPDPYLALRGAILEERLDRYKYEPFEKELAQLQLIQEGNKIWVEKPPNSFKDVCDSVAGVVYHCVMNTDFSGDSDLHELQIKAAESNLIIMPPVVV